MLPWFPCSKIVNFVACGNVISFLRTINTFLFSLMHFQSGSNPAREAWSETGRIAYHNLQIIDRRVHVDGGQKVFACFTVFACRSAKNMSQNGELSDDNRRSNLVLDGSLPQPLVPNFLVRSFSPNLLNLFPVFSCLAHILSHVMSCNVMLCHVMSCYHQASAAVLPWRPPPCCHLLGHAFYLWTAVTRSKFCRPCGEHCHVGQQTVQIITEWFTDSQNSHKLICPKPCRSRCRHAPSMMRTLQTTENHLLIRFVSFECSNYSNLLFISLLCYTLSLGMHWTV